jgi:hypothetical protein
VENISNQHVGVIAPAMPRVPAPAVLPGVVNADPRLRRTWGEVCPLTQAVQLQGTGLPSSTSVIAPVGGRVMGFDKYRMGSHAIGTGG